MAKKNNKMHQQESFPKTRRGVSITPKNETQRIYIDAIDSHDITFGVGPAGTGKTYLAALLALEYFTERKVDKIVICRPAINAGDEKIGFLPGSINQKMDPYVRPIMDAFQTYYTPQQISDLIGRGAIEIAPLAYMRGRTFTDTFVVADEMQNATSEQLLMLMTRLGYGSKMVVTGDPVQSDVNGKSCFNTAEGILTPVDTVGFVRFSDNDVVRHPTVKKILNVWFNNTIEDGDDGIVVPMRAL